MTDKVKVYDFFKRSETSDQVCNSAEDYAICEKINQEMESVKREAVAKFNHSRNISRHLILRSYGQSV